MQDIDHVYGCFREGYGKFLTHPISVNFSLEKYLLFHLETIPSPPENVSIHDVTAHSARIRWDPPRTHGDKVESYSLFYRIDSFANAIQEVCKNIFHHQF